MLRTKLRVRHRQPTTASRKEGYTYESDVKPVHWHTKCSFGPRLCGSVTVSGRIEEISDEEIKNNPETEEGVRNIPRFKNYQRGVPSNVSEYNSNITALEMLQNVYERNSMTSV